MSRFLSSVVSVALLGLMACHTAPDAQAVKDTARATGGAKPGTSAKKASNAEIMARKQVPVVCWHQIRDWRPRDSKSAKDDILPVASFKAHIKMLADSGYHTILPDQLYNYLVYGTALPAKPIMLTFDDTDLDQFTIARPELQKYGFKGVYFIMTVSLGRPHYMSREQVKQLSDEGNVIESHTYDHKNFKTYTGPDWAQQLDKPTTQIEKITGRKPEYFAFPYGLWNEQGLPELHKRFKAAFQLSTRRDPNDPLMTIRRIIDSGYWTTKGLSNAIRNSF